MSRLIVRNWLPRMRMFGAWWPVSEYGVRRVRRLRSRGARWRRVGSYRRLTRLDVFYTLVASPGWRLRYHHRGRLP